MTIRDKFYQKLEGKKLKEEQLDDTKKTDKIHNKLDESDDEEVKRQKRLAKWVPKPKKKKMGKNAELVAGWADEIKQVRASMQARKKK